MDFAKQQRDPRRHIIGFSAVVLFHGLVVWALVSGLAKKVVDVVRAPIETKVIEEIKKPPPPQEIAVPPPPRLEAPPPPYIPPPEVQIAAPPPVQATITAVTPTPPPAAVSIAPIAPPVAAPAPPRPAGPVTAAMVCTKMVLPEMPGVPETTGITGALVAYKATTQGGRIVAFEITKLQMQGGTDRKVQRAFAAAAEAAVREYVCPGEHVFAQEFVFKVE
jgi:protein TonB